MAMFIAYINRKVYSQLPKDYYNFSKT